MPARASICLRRLAQAWRLATCVGQPVPSCNKIFLSSMWHLHLVLIVFFVLVVFRMESIAFLFYGWHFIDLYFIDLLTCLIAKLAQVGHRTKPRAKPAPAFAFWINLN